MTDAGEKLRDRADAWYDNLSVAEMAKHGTVRSMLAEFASAELERAAKIVDDCQCDRSAKCSCAEHAAAIRRRKD